MAGLRQVPYRSSSLRKALSVQMQKRPTWPPGASLSRFSLFTSRRVIPTEKQTHLFRKASNTGLRQTETAKVLLAVTLQSYINLCINKVKSQPSLATILKASSLQSERQFMDGKRHTNIPQHHQTRFLEIKLQLL